MLCFFKNLDLLQIDAEGYDDEVIYNSSIDIFKPKFNVKEIIDIQKINNDIFGFGLTKIEYIKKPLELFCKEVRLSIIN